MTRLVKRLVFVFLRVVLFFPLVSFVAVLLYAFLPSPGPGDLEADALRRLGQSQHRGSDSFILKRVFKTRSFYSEGVETVADNESNTTVDLSPLFERSHMILDLSWNNARKQLKVLSIVKSVALSCPSNWRESRDNVEKEVEVGPVSSVYVGIGDDGDGIALPWFARADAVLLAAHTRPLVSEPAVARISLTTTCEVLDDAGGEELVRLALRPAQHRAQHRTPLITIDYHTNDASNTEPYSIRSISFPGNTDEDTEAVTAPSYTYPYRKTALDILATVIVDVSSSPHSTFFNATLTSVGFLFNHGLVAAIIFFAVVYFARNRKLQLEARAKRAKQAEVVPSWERHLSASGAQFVDDAGEDDQTSSVIVNLEGPISSGGEKGVSLNGRTET